MFSAYTMLFDQNVTLGDKENKSNQKGSVMGGRVTLPIIG